MKTKTTRAIFRITGQITHAYTRYGRIVLGGSACIYAHNSLLFTKKENLSINCDDLKMPVIETDNDKTKM